MDRISSKSFCLQTPPDHPDQREKFPSEQRLIISIDIRDHHALQMREFCVVVMVNCIDGPLGRAFRISHTDLQTVLPKVFFKPILTDAILHP